MKDIRPYLILLLMPATGCGVEPQPSDDQSPPPAPTAAGALHDPSASGSLRGRVFWTGEKPKLPPELAGVPTGSGYDWTTVANPWLPAIADSGGLAEVLLTLEGVDPARAKAWNLPPVRCEFDAARIVIRQGESPPRRIGIVRLGDEVAFQSTDARHHMLRARGTAFFTLPFPEPARPLLRRFDKPGWVELSSGAGYYWHAADLLVTQHPYHAVSDAAGAFLIEKIPPGTYTLIARVRNWRVVRQERDPETGLVFRQSFASPIEIRTAVTIQSGQAAEPTVHIPASAFTPR